MRFRTPLWIAAALLSAVPGIAQTTLPAPAGKPPVRDPFAKPDNVSLDERVQKAFENLRTRPSLRLSLDIQENIGPRMRRTNVTAFWKQFTVDGSGPALLEIREADITGFQKPLRRIVADGEHLTIYNVADNTYRRWNYKRRPNQGPERMLRILSEEVEDTPSEVIVRLLSQVYGSDFPVFQPWLPGAYANLDGSNVHYSRGAAPLTNTSITFFMFPLVQISGYEKTGEAIDAKITKWNLLIHNVILGRGWNGADFTFTPPNGSREVKSDD